MSLWDKIFFLSFSLLVFLILDFLVIVGKKKKRLGLLLSYPFAFSCVLLYLLPVVARPPPHTPA